MKISDLRAMLKDPKQGFKNWQPGDCFFKRNTIIKLVDVVEAAKNVIDNTSDKAIDHLRHTLKDFE